jgi:hypothetical protein
MVEFKLVSQMPVCSFVCLVALLGIHATNVAAPAIIVAIRISSVCLVQLLGALGVFVLDSEVL